MNVSHQLKYKTFHGLFWSFLESSGQQVIQFVISIVLARLLLPAQFGIIAMLSLFMALAQSVIDSGFGSALIRKQDATRLDESSIFYFNIVVGLVAATLLFLAAPWIAQFYNIPQLAPITRVLSLNLIINSFGIVQSTLMTKRVDFKTQMRVSVSAALLSGVLGVVLAYRGFGVWSLVVQSLCSSFLRTILLWLVYTWRPMWAFSFASLKSMFAYGSKLFMAGLLDTVYTNIYLLVIGKVYSAADLGYYSRAKNLEQLPVSNIQGSISRVTFPVFASIQNDKPRLKRGVREALKTVSLVNFPLMIGMAVCAEPLVRALLTDKWLPSVPYLQLLCFLGLLYPLHAINLNVLKAQGRSDLFFRLEIIKKVLVSVAILLTFHIGIIAMIMGQMVTSMLGYYINAYYTAKMIQYPISEQILDLLPTLTIAGVMGGAVYLLSINFVESQTVILFIKVLTGVVLYISISWVFKLPSMVFMVEKFGPKIRNFRLANLW